MKRIAFVLLLLGAQIAQADETYLHMGSYHVINRESLERHNGLNEQNFGFAMLHDGNEYGGYVNSYSRFSAYVVDRTYLSQHVYYSKGVVTGYPLFPVLPVVFIAYEKQNYRMAILPGVESPVVTLSVKF